MLKAFLIVAGLVLIGFLIGQLSRFIRYFSPKKIEGFSVLKLKIA